MKDRLPPGQVQTGKWPVLHYGPVPRFDAATWTLRLFGAVAREQGLDFESFSNLPQVDVTCDIHCVTRWSRFDNRFRGVPFRTLHELAKPKPEASHVMVHAEYGFTANLALEDLLRDDVVVALAHDGSPLAPEHGYPARLVVPHLYFWKSVKWVRGFEYLLQDARGYWERNGYHNHADPWREERFASQEPTD